ncbi:hypothetical protein [Pseudomonas helleri]|uniref:hypothetical protein n=1 Tax=Pseudomonas helleri TaxID=1608996 RepID=UPI001295A2CA|nr:hypothetical protein [Pseudomonas helleri]MQT34220.1 hypothetical protein [Pseudomonas helleri]
MKNQQSEIQHINNALHALINPNDSDSCIFPRSFIQSMKSVNADSVIDAMKAPALQKEYFSEGYSHSIFEKTENGKDQYVQAHLNALQIAVAIRNEAPVFYDEMKKFSRIVHEANKQAQANGVSNGYDNNYLALAERGLSNKLLQAYPAVRSDSLSSNDSDAKPKRKTLKP